ncbi:hypothetical protein [Phaeodactylibacter xiamenensis]|uniref:hypothetical protein n=1 Tax=Phaeodactylibacter xiamenensis TaxID=1524460 RepID=UPI0024A888E3|nr:hypothetical protein [Phaeodactylibacter xiamenensis]
MAKPKLTDLSKEELMKKAKGLKMMMSISIGLAIALAFAVIQGYLKTGELDWAILTIAICTLALPVTSYSEFKAVREELLARG